MRMLQISSLLFSTASGVIAVLGLFLFCFTIVHLFKLASLGRKFQKQSKNVPKSAPTPAPSEQKSENKENENPSFSPEPVFYIVERKRRTKSSFGEPKRIHFK